MNLKNSPNFYIVKSQKMKKNLVTEKRQIADNMVFFFIEIIV